MPPVVARVALSVPTLPPRVLGPSAAPADFLVADAAVSGADPRAPYRFARAAVEGGRVDGDYVVMGERRPDGLPFEDLWVTSDGARVVFRVRPPEGIVAVGTPGRVRVVFAGGGGEVEATAGFAVGPAFTLVLPSGAATSPGGFYSGPSPCEELVVVEGDAVRVGLRGWDAARDPGGVRSSFRRLCFDTWIDAARAPAAVVTEPPRVDLAAGRARVAYWGALDGGRYAQIEIDPRDAGQRLVVGRHAIAITWSTREGAARRERRVEARVVVRDDGTTAVEAAGRPSTATRSTG